MTTLSTTLGWGRALALGGALLVGAVTIAGPASADDGTDLNNACLGATTVNLSDLRETTLDSSHSFFEDTLATASGTEIEAAARTFDATSTIDQSESVGFTQVDGQSGAVHFNCNG